MPKQTSSCQDKNVIEVDTEQGPEDAQQQRPRMLANLQRWSIY
jgi:hypothetical protein